MSMLCVDELCHVWLDDTQSTKCTLLGWWITVWHCLVLTSGHPCIIYQVL